MSDFPVAAAHGPIRELFPDVYVVRGAMPMGPMMAIPRNMIVLRQGSELTLVNAMRLGPAGEAELERLGTVRHFVKLGPYHTRDEAWLRHRYAPTMWSAAPSDAAVERLVDGGPAPVDRAAVHTFGGVGSDESALVLGQHAGGLLVTCDSAQHWDSTEGATWLGGVVAWGMGFLQRPVTIGPIWAKHVTKGKLSALRPDFDRLLSRDFVHLVSGHGGLLRDVAKRELAASVDATLR